MGGLPLFFLLLHKSIIRPTNKTCFVSKLAILKYFDE